MTRMPRKMARAPKTELRQTEAPSPKPTPSPAPNPAPAAPSKISTLLDMLRRAEGATLGELVEVTGWLPHTTRAALTGLRKKGHVIEKAKRGDVTCYRVGGSA